MTASWSWSNPQACHIIFQNPSSKESLDESEIKHFFKINDPVYRELRTGPESTEFLFLQQILNKTSSPHFLKQLSYSLRRHEFQKNPLSDGNSLREFEAQRNLYSSQRKVDSPVLIWNIVHALQNHLGRGNLSEREAFFFAEVLGKKVKKEDFLVTKNEEIENLSHIQLNFLIEDIAALVVKNSRWRNALEALTQEKGFAQLLKGLIGHQPVALNKVDFEVQKVFRKMLDSIESGHYRLGQSLKAQDEAYFIFAILMTYGLRGEFTLALHLTQNYQVKTLNRNDVINKFEEIILDGGATESQTLTDVLNLVDLTLFKTPFPLSETMIEPLFIQSLLDRFLPLKSAALSRLPQKPSEVRNLVTLHTPQSQKPSSPQNQRFERVLTKNPKKRKNQEKKSPLHEEASLKNESVIEYTLLNTQDHVSDKAYTFQMARQSYEGIQKIIFSETVIDFFKENSQEIIDPFIKALSYGFTARDGSNGIKKLVASEGLSKSYYEVRPGSSGYRIILTRENGYWKAIDILHKDDIDRYLKK